MAVVSRIGTRGGAAARKIAEGSAAGPASYATPTGVAISTGLSVIDRVVVSCRGGAANRVDDFTREITYSISGGTVTVRMYEAQLSATNTWAEVADTTNLSTLTFDVIAIGY